MSGGGKDKSIMRSLGETFGHIIKAVKTNPAEKKVVVNKTRQQETRGNVTLRRTTIEEIEINDEKDQA